MPRFFFWKIAEIALPDEGRGCSAVSGPPPTSPSSLLCSHPTPLLHQQHEVYRTGGWLDSGNRWHSHLRHPSHLQEINEGAGGGSGVIHPMINKYTPIFLPLSCFQQLSSGLSAEIFVYHSLCARVTLRSVPPLPSHPSRSFSFRVGWLVFGFGADPRAHQHREEAFHRLQQALQRLESQNIWHLAASITSSLPG